MEAELWKALVEEVSRAYRALQYEEALAALQKAEEVAAGDQEKVWVSLVAGVIQGEQGKQEEALDAFGAALELKPDAVLPIEASVRVMRLFNKARLEHPDYRKRQKQKLTELALQAFGVRRYVETSETAVKLKRLPDLSPQEVAWAELMEGAAQGSIGNSVAAEQAFNRGLELSGEKELPVAVSPEVRKIFERAKGTRRHQQLLRDAKRLYAGKQYQEVLTALAGAEQSPTLAGDERRSIHLLRGQALAELGKPEEAVGSFKQVLRMDPGVRLTAPESSTQKELFDRAGYELRHALRPFSWIAGGAGVAMIGGGVACLAQARGREHQLQSADPAITTYQQRMEAVQSGEAFQAAGWSLAVAGLAGLTVGTLMFFREAPPGDWQVSVAFTPRSATAGMTWSLP